MCTESCYVMSFNKVFIQYEEVNKPCYITKRDSTHDGAKKIITMLLET